ncbi:MAG: hypothetical protein J6573_08430 [Lactobacillus sp.]|nr:hypothetical protein [Lactobacillus sp.]
MRPKVKNHILVVPIKGSITIEGTPRTFIEIEDSDHIIQNSLYLCNGKNTIKEINIKLKKLYHKLTDTEIYGYLDQLMEIPLNCLI